ncbi:MAG: hypothetical protein IRF16MM_02670 [Candidatus Midichloria mitochondrii]
MTSLPKELIELNLTKNNIWLFLSLIFFNLLPKSGDPYIQRFLMTKSSRQLARCMNSLALIDFAFTMIIMIISFVDFLLEPKTPT